MANFRFRQLVKWSLAISITLLFSSGVSLQGFPLRWKLIAAASANETPSKLNEVLNQLETAANKQKLRSVRRTYHRDFSTSDGLSRKALTKQLKKLWNKYSQLNYEIELKSWERNGDEIVAETVTNIEGFRQAHGREMRLEAQLRSRQELVEDKIVSQTILSERSQVSIGDDAPSVSVNSPEQVKVGETFSFDVIVKEPTANERFLGTALAKKVNPNQYVNSQQFDLDMLPSAGIYRLGTAPDSPGKRWLSAIIVGDGGMTLISQRLTIVPETSEALLPSKHDQLSSLD